MPPRSKNGKNHDAPTETEVIVIEAPDFEKEKKLRRYYKDLVRLDTSELAKRSSVMIKEKIIDDLIFFAQINELQFRRLWLLFQYELYKTGKTFKEGKEQYRSQVRSSPALGGRDPDSVIAPNRRQTLGALRENKIRTFAEYFDYVKMGTRNHFDIYWYCLNAPLEDLFLPPKSVVTEFETDDTNQFYNEEPLDLVNSIIGSSIKLPVELWNAIKNHDMEYLRNVYIILPRIGVDHNSKSVDIGWELASRMDHAESDSSDLFAVFEG